MLRRTPALRPLAALAGVTLAVLSAAFVAGCGSPQSGPARAQDSARELNLNARFGRSELVIERVAPSERDEFLRKHRAWGGAVRIADNELIGFSLPKDTEALIVVKVAWYRQDEQELRITTLRQRFRDFKGEWLLVAEDRIDGDLGLLGEKVVVPPGSDDARAARRSAQFPTIHLSE